MRGVDDNFARMFVEHTPPPSDVRPVEIMVRTIPQPVNGGRIHGYPRHFQIPTLPKHQLSNEYTGRTSAISDVVKNLKTYLRTSLGLVRTKVEEDLQGIPDKGLRRIIRKEFMRFKASTAMENIDDFFLGINLIVMLYQPLIQNNGYQKPNQESNGSF